MSDTPISPDPEQDAAVKPFALFLTEQSNGTLHSELSERLQELVQAVMQHDKAGALTLKITVKPAGNGVNVVISDEVKLSAPEPQRPVALWYADDEGNVTRRDPRQPELPLRELNSSRERKAG